MTKKGILVKSLVVLVAFSIALFGKKILNSFIDVSFSHSSMTVIYTYLWWVFPVIITVGMLFGYRNILKNLWINRGMLIGFIFAFVLTLPMLISSAIIGHVDTDLTVVNFLHYTLIGAFMEEFLFRGFLFGILFNKLKWGFIPASMLGAIFFGLGHLYQGSIFLESLNVFLVTFMGALWFAWLFVEWNNNLWIPIFLHVFMNVSWTLFNVGNNAAGSASTNVFRVITISLTIIITIIHNKRTGKRSVTWHNLLVNN